jgi:hypothetical protein
MPVPQPGIAYLSQWYCQHRFPGISDRSHALLCSQPGSALLPPTKTRYHAKICQKKEKSPQQHCLRPDFQ